jgi:hypothetical protein
VTYTVRGSTRPRRAARPAVLEPRHLRRLPLLEVEAGQPGPGRPGLEHQAPGRLPGRPLGVRRPPESDARHLVCAEADLEQRGGKQICPACPYVQPCCQP